MFTETTKRVAENNKGVRTMSTMSQVSLVLAALSIILGAVTAIVNLRRLREDRLWLESNHGSNRSEDNTNTEDQDSTFPSA